jgi:hypothetical protein
MPDTVVVSLNRKPSFAAGRIEKAEIEAVGARCKIRTDRYSRLI